MKYRHEFKYLCDQRDKALLQSRLTRLMRPDPNAGADASYLIKSIYFDDWRNSCLAENESGVDDRSKFRIRAYDNRDDVIKMEIKHKEHGMTRKESCRVSRRVLDRMLQEQAYPIDPAGAAVYNRFCLEHKARLLRPVCTIGYERTAYVLPEGNVRITLDERIFASRDTVHFFEPTQRIPVLPTGHFVLEVKYDAFLPQQIRQALEIDTLRQTAFSKYYLGRQALRGKTLE